MFGIFVVASGAYYFKDQINELRRRDLDADNYEEKKEEDEDKKEDKQDEKKEENEDKTKGDYYDFNENAYASPF